MKIAKSPAILAFGLVVVLTLGTATAFVLTDSTGFSEPAAEETYRPTTPGWHQIEVGPISIEVPADFSYYPGQSSAPYTGMISNGSNQLHIDYSQSATSFAEEPIKSYDTIHDKIMRLVLFEAEGEFSTALYFPLPDRAEALSITSNLDTALSYRIFRSITIDGKTGYTSARLGAGFAESKLIATGEQLFRHNCKVCHDMDKVLVGPALRGVPSRMGEDWVKQWVLRPMKFIREDPRAEALWQEYGQLSHTTYTNMTEEELESIIRYLDTQEARSW